MRPRRVAAGRLGTAAVATVRVDITGLLILRSGRAVTATARAVIDLSGAA